MIPRELLLIRYFFSYTHMWFLITIMERVYSSWVRKIPWRRAWQPTPAFLPGESLGESHGEEPGGLESDTTEHTHDDGLEFSAFCQNFTWILLLCWKISSAKMRKGEVWDLVLKKDHFQAFLCAPLVSVYIWVGYLGIIFLYLFKSKFPENLLNNLSHSFLYTNSVNVWVITMGTGDGIH